MRPPAHCHRSDRTAHSRGTLLWRLYRSSLHEAPSAASGRHRSRRGRRRGLHLRSRGLKYAAAVHARECRTMWAARLGLLRLCVKLFPTHCDIVKGVPPDTRDEFSIVSAHLPTFDNGGRNGSAGEGAAGDAGPRRFWHAWRCAIDGHQSGTARPDNEQQLNRSGLQRSAALGIILESDPCRRRGKRPHGPIQRATGNHRSDKAPVARSAVGRRVNICSASSLPGSTGQRCR